MKTHTTTQQYLLLFNTIDKHLDKHVQADGFMPFNEKLKEIIKSDQPLRKILQHYEQELKLFGEIRNHLIHSSRLNGPEYLLPTPEALGQLQTIAQRITTPPTVQSLIKQTVYTTSLDDGLLSCLQVMQQYWYSHIPVMNDTWTYVYTLSHRLVCDRIASHPDIDITQDNKISELLEDRQADNNTDNLFPRTSRRYEYEFVSADTSIDEVEHLFAQASNTRRPLGAVYISQDGQSHSPLMGIFTSGDVVMLEGLR